ncbi:MAG TPA: dienelactone hydrolase family protein [Rubricoccaceae bacterium]|jgi:carboxymethylenebutenolidase
MSRLFVLATALLISASACQTTAPADTSASTPASAPDGGYAGEMRHQHDGETPTASGAAAGAEALDVVSETVTYATVGGQPVSGTLVTPRGAAPGLPGLIVVHEWWGLNDNIRAMAARYANEGYAVLAVDLYGGEAAATPDAAMALMQAAFAAPDQLQDNLRQAYAYLTNRGAERVGVLGWCFGGNQALQAALALPTEIDATVIYYGGNPPSDAAALRPLQMPVLGLYGEADTSIPLTAVSAFDAALTQAGVEHEFHIYPGAGHAFANPSGQSYNPAAATDAWTRTTAFLAANLR